MHALPDEYTLPLARDADRLEPFRDRISWYPEVSSTNDLALSLADGGAGEGCVVIADAQVSGRGRRGHSWSSPAGAGVYASVILRPRPDSAGLLTLAAGVAIAEGIQAASGLATVLKWPNDIYVHAPPGIGRKLAGVLAEASTSRASIHHVVLGFGINVRQAAYPPDVAARATSIDAELGRWVDRGLVLVECLAALWNRYRDLHEGRAADVVTAWRQRAAATFGRRVEWNDGTHDVSGVAEDIASTGALLVRTASGVAQVLSGDVRWT